MIDSLKKKHEAALLNIPTFKEDGRAIWINPAYSILKDPDSGENYGNHGMEIDFALRVGDRAVTTSFYTTYMTNEPMSKRHMDISGDLMGTGLYYHFHTKEVGVDDYARVGDDCHMFDNGKCWGQAGSSLHGDDIAVMLVNEGSDAVFKEMERAIKEDFEPYEDADATT